MSLRIRILILGLVGFLAVIGFILHFIDPVAKSEPIEKLTVTIAGTTTKNSADKYTYAFYCLESFPPVGGISYRYGHQLPSGRSTTLEKTYNSVPQGKYRITFMVEERSKSGKNPAVLCTRKSELDLTESREVQINLDFNMCITNLYVTHVSGDAITIRNK